MKDEARNTGQHSSLWGRDTRLRAKPVGFVSAGLFEPFKHQPRDLQDDNHSKGIDETILAVHNAPQQISSTLPTDGGDIIPDTLEQPPASLESSVSPRPVSAADTPAILTTDVSLAAGMGFVIDVTGDKSLAAKLPLTSPRISEPQSPAEESDSSSEVILFKGRANLTRSTQLVDQRRTEQTITLDTIQYEIKAVEAEGAANHSPVHDTTLPSRPRRRQRVNHDNSKETDDEEEAIIADYIANMAEDSDDGDEGPYTQPLMSADLGADNGDLGDVTSDLSLASDDSAASDDQGETAIDGGVVGDGDSEGDDTAGPTMDDETLARLLAKQEELGLGSDELLLASGAAGGRGSAYYANSSKRSRRGKAGMGHTQGIIPSASAVADAFDDLDLMDWQRPSLQNQRKRGRRGQPPVFGLSDSEMEETLQTAWQKDRESKKSRKLRREELRAQGLLGKHADPDDPRLKYPTGMTMEDIKTEMRAFLIGSEPR